jgi:hypothetical protein
MVTCYGSKLSRVPGNLATEDIRSFAEQQVRVAAAEFPGVYAAYVSGAGFTQGAIQEARGRGITLLTLKAMNELARAVGQQPFTPP